MCEGFSFLKMMHCNYYTGSIYTGAYIMTDSYKLIIKKDSLIVIECNFLTVIEINRIVYFKILEE